MKPNISKNGDLCEWVGLAQASNDAYYAASLAYDELISVNGRIENNH